MENFFLSILQVLDRKLSKQLSNVEKLIKKNRNEFDDLVKQTQIIRNQVIDYNESENEESSATEQIEFMFKVMQKDPQFTSFKDFDVSKIMSVDQDLSKMNEVII